MVPVNRIADYLRMNAIDGALKIADAHDTVDEIRLDIVVTLRAKGLLEIARPAIHVDDLVRRMMRLKCSSEVLRREQMKMLFDRQDGCLGVKMVD